MLARLRQSCLQSSVEPIFYLWTKGVGVGLPFRRDWEGLIVTGLLGIVARAKQAGLIDLAKPVLDELIHNARFWIGPELYAEVLAELGEG